jgi:hypothetical protein
LSFLFVVCQISHVCHTQTPWDLAWLSDLSILSLAWLSDPSVLRLAWLSNPRLDQRTLGEAWLPDPQRLGPCQTSMPKSDTHVRPMARSARPTPRSTTPACLGLTVMPDSSKLRFGGNVRPKWLGSNGHASPNDFDMRMW